MVMNTPTLIIGVIGAIVLLALSVILPFVHAQTTCSDDDIMKRYPTPELLQDALKDGRETCKLSERMMILMDGYEVPIEKQSNSGLFFTIGMTVIILTSFVFMVIMVSRKSDDGYINRSVYSKQDKEPFYVNLLPSFLKRNSLLPHPSHCCEDCGIYHIHWCKVNKKECTI